MGGLSIHISDTGVGRPVANVYTEQFRDDRLLKQCQTRLDARC